VFSLLRLVGDWTAQKLLHITLVVAYHVLDSLMFQNHEAADTKLGRNTLIAGC
jgi:hypothetical protein